MRAVVLMFMIFLSGCKAPEGHDITIAVAANMQFAIDELVSKFETTSGLRCATVISSSGKLTAQIMEGAPYDILISADMKYPEQLYRSGITTDSPYVYAYGKLVLWSMAGRSKPSIEALDSNIIKHLAIANPRTAPYGKAAMEVIETSGLLESVKEKLVYGESISQTNQFIISGAAEAGFTAKSVVLSNRMEGVGQWIDIKQGLYTPIAQGVVIVANNNSDRAKVFFDFLFSPEGQEILEKFGFDRMK